jgi:hypothetical protein
MLRKRALPSQSDESRSSFSTYAAFAPSALTVADVALTSPHTIPMSVVFPAPFGRAARKTPTHTSSTAS